MVSSSVLPTNRVDENAASMDADMNADKAVNLYSVLEVSPDAEDEAIRRRINNLFLEAQSNIDHRNFRRRFYYQELYEVHLPQARLHLLNPERRHAYDHSLKLRVLPSLTNAPHEYSLDSLPTVREENAVNLGADGLDLNSLPSVDDAAQTRAQETQIEIARRQAKLRADNLAATQQLQAQRTLSPADAAAFARFKAAQEESQPAQTVANPPRSTPQTTPQPMPAPYNARPLETTTAQTEAIQLERRRDMKRRELIKYELMAVGTQWAAISAFGTLAIGIAAWFGIQHWIQTKNVGADFLINLGGVVACCFIAAAVGRTAHREARRRTVALLSQMPYEQLLRRCAQR